MVPKYPQQALLNKTHIKRKKSRCQGDQKSRDHSDSATHKPPKFPCGIPYIMKHFDKAPKFHPYSKKILQCMKELF